MPQTTFTTSATGTAVISLNPVAKSTTLTLTSTTAFAAGSSNSALQLDMAVGDASAFPAQTLAWAAISSAVGMKSSDISANGLVYTVLSPVSAARINVTAASTVGAFTFTLTALQSVTA